jgi:catechol 2,3-dioxygenase-like lactoylglutathione lyase family enzyme
MEPRISIITLGVSDLKASTSFYRDGLKFPLLTQKSSDEISFFEVNKGSLWLALYPAPLLAEDARVAHEGTGFKGFTLAHNVRTPADVHEVVQQAVAAGATLAKEPQKVFWGGYSGYFADPDGFLWEVAHNPFSWIE